MRCGTIPYTLFLISFQFSNLDGRKNFPFFSFPCDNMEEEEEGEESSLGYFFAESVW